MNLDLFDSFTDHAKEDEILPAGSVLTKRKVTKDEKKEEFVVTVSPSDDLPAKVTDPLHLNGLQLTANDEMTSGPKAGGGERGGSSM